MPVMESTYPGWLLITSTKLRIKVTKMASPEKIELLRNFFIIGEGKFIASHRYPLTDTGFAVKIIILAKAVLVQYFIYGFTSYTAEYFIG
jgi:hypothetical protein